MIEAGTLQIESDRVRVSLRMPWYRALPFSSVASVDWTIDGHTVAPESLTWTCDGVSMPLADLAARYDLWWYVLDSAVVEGDVPAGLDDRPDHLVEVELGLYIPYITTDLGVLRLGERDRKSMALEVAA
jgi:hypothetical protein